MKSFKEFLGEAIPHVKIDLRVATSAEQDQAQKTHERVGVHGNLDGSIDPAKTRVDKKNGDIYYTTQMGVRYIIPKVSNYTKRILYTYLNEMVSGDSGGDATKIASGENSGDVVRGNEPKKKQKMVRRLSTKSAGISYAKAGLPKDGLPTPDDFRE